VKQKELWRRYDRQDVFQGEFTQDQAGYVVVHTDGACSNNGKASAKVSVSCTVFLSGNTLHHFDADSDSTYHPGLDPYSDFFFCADADPDPVPTSHLMRIRVLLFVRIRIRPKW
jgi:hypothetical protein